MFTKKKRHAEGTVPVSAGGKFVAKLAADLHLDEVCFFQLQTQ